MEKRDMAILVLALVVVMVMAVVVKPMLTGTTPDMSLPFQAVPTPTPLATPSTAAETMVQGTMVQGTVLSTTPVPTIIPQTSIPVRISTPGIPQASFSAAPRSGPIPLRVQFSDTSTGIPTEWAWSFGDGTGSSEENPLHVFAEEGLFQVSLNAKNTYGANTRIVQGFINVTPPRGQDILLEADRGGSLAPGGFLEWTVSSPGTKMKIGGQVQNLDAGDRIRLLVEEGGKGKISVVHGAILEFSFDDVSLYRNGRLVSKGLVREISVPEADHFLSSLRLVIPPGSGTVRILESGGPGAVPGPGSTIVIESMRPDADGMMNLDCFRPDYTYFRGTVNPVSR
jgi:PKD repeat protein